MRHDDNIASLCGLADSVDDELAQLVARPQPHSTRMPEPADPVGRGELSAGKVGDDTLQQALPPFRIGDEAGIEPLFLGGERDDLFVDVPEPETTRDLPTDAVASSPTRMRNRDDPCRHSVSSV